MSDPRTDEDRRRIRQAADYLIQQHGDGAIAEAEAALRHAAELNDKVTIEAFADILLLLRHAR